MYPWHFLYRVILKSLYIFWSNRFYHTICSNIKNHVTWEYIFNTFQCDNLVKLDTTPSLNLQFPIISLWPPCMSRHNLQFQYISVWQPCMSRHSPQFQYISMGPSWMSRNNPSQFPVDEKPFSRNAVLTSETGKELTMLSVQCCRSPSAKPCPL